MRSVGILLLLLVVGCSSLDPVVETNIDSALARASTDPEGALREIDQIVSQNPGHVRAHLARAEIQLQLGRLDDAATTYGKVLHDLNPSSREERSAHRGLATVNQTRLGPLPDRVQPPTGDLRNRIQAMLDGWDHVLDDQPRDVVALRGKAEGHYRLGEFAAAEKVAGDLVEDDPGDSEALLLLLLTRENRYGLGDDLLAGYFELLQTPSEDIQQDAARHLTWLVTEGPELPIPTRDGVEGRLIRYARSLTAIPPFLDQWIDNYQNVKSDRMRELQRRRTLLAIDTAMAAEDWGVAWQEVRKLPPDEPALTEKRVIIANRRVTELVENGNQLLELGALTDAREVEEELETLRQEELTPATRALDQDFSQRYHLVTREFRVRECVEQANRLLDPPTSPERAREALEVLDQVHSDVPDSSLQEYGKVRARALVLWGETEEALELLDSLEESGQLVDPHLRRLYGILLAENDRGEDAETVLEALPLNAFNTPALEGLLTALESQGKWEEVLTRLSALQQIPGRFRPFLLRAASEAGRRRLRRNDPEGALIVLNSYLRSPDLKQSPVREVYLESMLKDGRAREAVEFLLSDGVTAFGAMPTELLQLFKTETSDFLTDEQRFRLYIRLRNSNDPEVEEELSRLWSQFGDYMLPAGDYRLTYLSYDPGLVAEGHSPHKTEKAIDMTWAGRGFQVRKAGQPDETWIVNNGVLEKTLPEGTLRIPVKVTGSPPYDPIESWLKRHQWTAKVEATFLEVNTPLRAFDGCLKVKVSSLSDPSNYHVLYFAPESGEVKREIYKQDTLVEIIELARVEVKPKED